MIQTRHTQTEHLRKCFYFLLFALTHIHGVVWASLKERRKQTADNVPVTTLTVATQGRAKYFIVCWFGEPGSGGNSIVTSAASDRLFGSAARFWRQKWARWGIIWKGSKVSCYGIKNYGYKNGARAFRNLIIHWLKSSRFSSSASKSRAGLQPHSHISSLKFSEIHCKSWASPVERVARACDGWISRRTCVHTAVSLFFFFSYSLQRTVLLVRRYQMPFVLLGDATRVPLPACTLAKKPNLFCNFIHQTWKRYTYI